MGRIKNHIAIKENIATIERDGKRFNCDVSKKNWQQNLIADLEKNGIGNGVARNIAYKVSCLQKS